MGTDMAEQTADAAAGAARPVITEFAGSAGGPFAVYGEHLDRGGQLTINGLVPAVMSRNARAIKGSLAGLPLEPGAALVRLDKALYGGRI